MGFPTPTCEIGSFPDVEAVRALAPALAAAAQAVYDGWEQGADGLDPELGAGGICHEIADAFMPILCGAGVGHCLTMQAGVGENHVYALALLSDGVYEIDIPARVYETGGGYAWLKRPGVTIGADDVTVFRVADAMSADAFEDAYGG